MLRTGMAITHSSKHAATRALPGLAASIRRERHDADFLRDLPQHLVSDRGHIGSTRGRYAFSGTDKQHPRAIQYARGIRHGVYLLDAEETHPALRRAALAIKEVIADGGHVLVVGNPQDDVALRELNSLVAESRQVHALTVPWMRGMFTNWREFGKNLAHFRVARSRKMLAARRARGNAGE